MMRRLLPALLVGLGFGLLLGTPTLVSVPTSGSVAVGMWADPATAGSTGGGWIVWSNGHVVENGGVPFYGDAPSKHIAVSDIVGMLPTEDGGGYWLVGADGGVFTFGNARYYGSLPGSGITPEPPAIGMSYCSQASGYTIVLQSGEWYSFNC